MKMNPAFHTPVRGIADHLVDASGSTVARCYGHGMQARTDQARAAAHAINCHEELVEALAYLCESVEPPPEKNCSCHIAPPCSDCVDYGALREALDDARAILKKAKGV